MPDLAILIRYVKVEGEKEMVKTPSVKCPKYGSEVVFSLYDKCLSTANPCKYCGKLTFQVLSCAFGEGE